MHGKKLKRSIGQITTRSWFTRLPSIGIDFSGYPTYQALKPRHIVEAFSWYVFLVPGRFLCLLLFVLFQLNVCVCTHAQDIDPQFEPQSSKLGNLCAPCDTVTATANDLKYRIAVKYRNADGTLVMHVVPRRHFRQDREGFIVLACKLRKDFGAKADVFVRIFDNNDAAKKYVDPSSQHKPRDWQLYAKSFKAFYSWKPIANQNFVVWDFDPLIATSEETRYAVANLCLSPR